jgi:hypothetical protein
MTLPAVSSGPRTAVIVLSLLVLLAVASPLAVQEAAQKIVPAVAPGALEPLLPVLDGWTKVRAASHRIDSADSCTYVYAEAVYTSDTGKLRVTMADTGFNPDGLTAVATIVVSFPANYTETIPPDTTISRVTYRESPAASLWNNTKRDGEFTVIVGGRFVAKVEGTPVDSLETLRGVMDRLDLKRLADLGR